MNTMNRDGFTLAEVVISILLLSLTISVMLTSFVMGRYSTAHARYHTQAMNLVQAKAEELAAGKYIEVQSEDPQEVVVDPGKDGIWGNGDDLRGSLSVEVADNDDLDGDGDIDEQEIDVDGDGKNDPCKPLNIRLSWTCLSYGGSLPMTVHLDTLISER